MASLSSDSLSESVLFEPNEGSAVRSHQSYDSQVHAICHHSGQYLTRNETYPKWINPLRGHYDFPGIPELDDEFAQAAHAQNHQHWVWSKPGIAGVALVISNLLLLFLITRVLTRRDQVTTEVTEFVLFYTLLVVSAIIGIGLLIRGAWLIANRTAVYHRRAIQHNQPPEITDFPLLHCKYKIAAREYLDVNLGNDQLMSPEDAKRTLRGQLTVNLHPDDASQENCKIYLQRYAQHNIENDLHLHAGTLALEHVGNVAFGNQPAELIDVGHRTVMMAMPIEFDHRIVMRAPVPRSFKEGSYTREDGSLITITAPYMYRPPARHQEHDERQRFALECLPKLNSHDSYTLELHFRWWSNSNQKFFLDECRLPIPPELETVDRIQRGRFDTQRREVIWRNLMFKSQANQPGNDNTTSSQEGTPTKRVGVIAPDESQPRANDIEQTLVLSVSFSKPLLEYQPIFKGSYRCSFDGLLSGMSISPERIWTARGLKVMEDDKESIPIIKRLTTIKGNITVDTRQLSQRHENVHPITIPCPDAPNHKLVDKILRALTRCDVDLQRIEQAIPRLDPAGGLRTRLHYWEIVGRLYNPSTLESIDVHVVISGYDQAIQEAADLPRTHIDLRVRCTHDPRNSSTPQYAMKLRGILVEELQREGVGSAPGYRVSDTAGCLCVTLDQDATGWYLSVENTGDHEVRDITIELYPSENVDVNKKYVEIHKLHSAESWKAELVMSDGSSAWRLRPIGLSGTSLFKKHQELDVKIRETSERIFHLEQEQMMALGGLVGRQLEQQIEQQKNALRQYERDQQEVETFTLAFIATYAPEGSNDRESFNGELSDIISVRVSL